MKKIAAILLIVLLGSCKNTWDSDDKDAWRQACMENATKWAGSDDKAKTYCDCVLQKMMEKYPHENDALEHIDELTKDSSVQSCKTEVMKK
jgi:hypothetical protein